MATIGARSCSFFVAYHLARARVQVGKLMFEHPTPMGDQSLKRVNPVLDPSMSAEASRRLRRKISYGAEDAEAAIGCGFALGLFGTIPLVILHFVVGLSWWWMIVPVLSILIGLGVAPVIASNSKLKRHDYDHFIQASDLDEPSRELMFRAQEAIRGALSSAVYAQKSLHHAVEDRVLRGHEWDVAIALQKISTLRSELNASTKGGSPGPRTAAVLNSQWHALTVATEATTSRISALERYTAELQMADAAECDWQAAMKASGRNDQYIDLITRTAADEHAVAEIEGLTEHAAVAAQVLDEHLYQASLAAQALVLPTTPKDPQSGILGSCGN